MTTSQVLDQLLNQRKYLPLERGINLRDLGAYSTIDGGTTRWGSLLRSGYMHLLTASGQQKQLDYGLGAVVDPRMPPEVDASPGVFKSIRTLESSQNKQI